MFAIAEYQQSLERVAAILRQLRIRFSLTGGAAFIAYGDPRTTQDVDLVVDAVQLKASLAQAISLLQAAGFLVSEATIVDSVGHGRQFQLIDLESTLKLDLYPRELISGELSRAVDIEVLPGLILPIVARTDLLLSKLIWVSRGSTKSRRDVKELARL
ncbi:MAG: nucleotidyl transferase AbiEii/AbiGii toxin family protein, partial [Planctomycetaceae bacterium]